MSSQESKPTKLSSRWRITLSVLLVVIPTFVVVYKVINHIELETTSALFIGLPMLIGLLVVNLTRTRNIFGMSVKVSFIILCLIAPLLGEGSICILMMAPLFIGINFFMILIYQIVKNRYQKIMFLVVCLPFFMGFVEKSKVQNQEFSTITTQITVKGTVEQWQEDISNSTYISKHIPFFLRLGFPLPIEIADQEQASTLKIKFNKGGFWDVQKTSGQDFITYTLKEDTSKIGNWIDIKGSHIRLVAVNDDEVLIEQTTRYISKVFPRWYFSFFQKLAIRQMHQLALASWERT